MNSAVPKLRADFPIFAVKPDWAYLDTAATSQVPQQILDTIAEYHCAYRAPVHRGLYREALRATQGYEDARAKIAKYIGAAHPHEVVFTAGATASSNMLTYSLEHSIDWHEGDEIVTTVMEHHSSLIPLQELAKRKKLVLKHIPLSHGEVLAYESVPGIITKRTRLVSVMLASNVLGTLNEVARIAEYAHAVGAVMISDATAAVGHVPVSVVDAGLDCMYFSGHKMCGPTGIGVLYATTAMLEWLHPGFFGGGMIEHTSLTDASWAPVPHKFEAGTPNIVGAIGLGAAFEYLQENDMGEITQYIQALVTRAIDALSHLAGVTVYAALPEHNVGIVSFTVAGVHPHDVAEIAARHDVAVRAGHHCAMPLHAALGVSATLRASFYLYNTMADIDALVASVREAQRIFAR